jgi:hypothetical protein
VPASRAHVASTGQKTLQKSLDTGLHHLKREVERTAAVVEP